ncbi:MAG: hypothetical protein JXR95_12065 [Deltaproteobacteria bacterium]|nr:hypothetical protein [Deltaproteobacteria bacterium]
MEQSQSDTALDVINSIPEYVSEIRKNFIDSADLFRLGKVKDALTLFSQVIDALANLMELVERLAEMKMLELGETYTRVQTDVGNFLVMIEEAYGKGDLIALADVIEYESETIEILKELKLSKENS